MQIEIGNGIAIAGTWIFAGIAWSSKRVSNFGFWLALAAASIATYYLR